jgi:uncharacterized membrane protein
LKLKVLNWILIIDLLSVLLILSIIFTPSSVVRVILGLPFLFFFPGFTLASVLFARKKGIGNIEFVALSCGMSIAVTALIGFILNYTPWGIRLETVLDFITVFVFITSAIALIRDAQTSKTLKFSTESTLNVPGWGGSILNKSLSIVLAIAIIGVIGTLGFTAMKPKIGEKFSEFYILGRNGTAAEYPTDYILNNGQITQVTYNDGLVDETTGFGKITLGIVNQQQQTAVYSVKMTINGQPAAIEFNGTPTDILGPIELAQGAQWVNQIGITPNAVGDNQEVELSLYNGTGTTIEDSVHFWIDVKLAN